MSHRPWLGFVAVAAFLVAGCVSEEKEPPPPPPPAPPAGQHVCLEIWGVSAQGLKEALDAEKAAHGQGWGLHARPKQVYDKLVQLGLSLETALGAPPMAALPYIDDATIVAGSIAITADAVRTQLDQIDRVWAGHAPTSAGWLTRPTPTNPAIPLARALLQSIREAVDM